VDGLTAGEDGGGAGNDDEEGNEVGEEGTYEDISSFYLRSSLPSFLSTT